jgi:hypothetical protein
MSEEARLLRPGFFFGDGGVSEGRCTARKYCARQGVPVAINSVLPAASR